MAGTKLSKQRERKHYDQENKSVNSVNNVQEGPTKLSIIFKGTCNQNHLFL